MDARNDSVYGPGGETSPVDLMDSTNHHWRMYSWMREHAPVYKDSNGLWHISRYADIIDASRRPGLFTSTMGNRPQLPADESFINLDGPKHKARRGLISAHFSPKAMRKLEQHVRVATNELINDVIEQGSCDFVAAIAAPLPVRITCEMTGVPDDMQGIVCEWLDVFIKGGQGPDHVTEEVNEAFFNFGGLHMDLVDARRVEPKDDLLSLWVNAEVDGEPMTEDDLLWEHTMLMVGGSETTRNAISGGVLELARRPEQRSYLAEDRERIPKGFEEILRWVTPFTSMSRTLTEDTEWHGVRMKRGEELVMLYPPANRDPRAFDDPETFNVRRGFKNKIISFGYGSHFCLGAFLARLEGRVVFEEMLRRMPDWQVVGDPKEPFSNFLRGYESLPITFTPGKRETS